MEQKLEIIEDQIWLIKPHNKTKLALSATRFEILAEYTNSHRYGAWVQNADGYFYVSTDAVKKLKTATLVPVSVDYAVNASTVFFGATPLPNSHPESFNVVGETGYFAFDKNQVYALSQSAEGVQIWDAVDIPSLVFWPSLEFFADKNHLYRFNWHFIEYHNHFVDSEESALTASHFYDEHGAERDLSDAEKTKIIAREGTIARSLRHQHPKADAWWNWSAQKYAALTHLAHNIYHDDKRVFCFIGKDDPFQHTGDTDCFSVVANADLPSFKPLDHFYAKDKNSVFHFQRKLAEADAATFVSLGENFARDKANIFFNGHVCKEADADSFEVIGQGFARDKQNLFAAMPGSRIGKFRGYARLLCVVKDADPTSFSLVATKWAKDRHQVYCGTKALKEADAPSFRFLFDEGSNSWACSSHGLHNANGRVTITAIDAPTFIVLNHMWGRDKNSVFCFESKRVVKGIDAASFEVLDEVGSAQDKSYAYYFDELHTLQKRARKS